jgi:hypothetical protein
LSLLRRLPHSEKGFGERTPRKRTRSETCKPVSQRIKSKAFPALPLYDNFNIQLKGEELEQLKVLWKEYGAQDCAIPKNLVNERWELKGLVESEGSGSYQFTDLGKIPVGALPKPRCSTKSKNRCCCRSWLCWNAL